MPTLTEQLGLPPAPRLFDRAGGPPAPPPMIPGAPPPKADSPPVPAGLRLLNFQAEGVHFLLDHPAALLGDEMGLGKSIQAITALRLLFLQGKVRQVLIICPKTVLFDWFFKLRRWAPELKSVMVEGPGRRRWWTWRCPVHAYVCGYETWRRDGAAVPSDAFDLIILDEVQKAKRPDTQIARALRRLEAPRRWALSGTPMENRAAELIAVFDLLVPGLLSGIGARHADRVRERVRPYLLRRRVEEVLSELPPKIPEIIWLDLPPAQRSAYDRAEAAGRAALAAGAGTAHVFALYNRLKQLCNYDPESGTSVKLDFLCQELSQICHRGEKALLFSQYPRVSLAPLLPRLQPFAPALFDGSLKDYARAELIYSFQEQDVPRLLCMSLKAGSTGITLTRANHVYHLDHWWNATAADQAEGRAHRIGQTRPVHVKTLLCRGTVEERIARMLAEKRELFTQVVDDLSIGEGEARGRTPPGVVGKVCSRNPGRTRRRGGEKSVW